MSRPALLIVLGILGMLSTVISTMTIPLLRKKIRMAAVFNTIGSLFIVAFQIGFYLEGYFGLASAFMMGGFAFFLICAFAVIVAATFRPIIAVTHKSNQATYLFWYQTLGFSSVVFFSWVIPYTSSLVGDWLSYNQRTIIFFWGVTLNFIVFLTVPFILVVSKFESTTASIGDNIARSDHQIADLVKSMKSLRNHVASQTIPLGIIALYNTITVFGYGQVALQPLIFFVFLMSPITFSLGVSVFLIRVIKQHRGSSDDRPSSKKMNAWVDLSTVSAGADISKHQSQTPPNGGNA